MSEGYVGECALNGHPEGFFISFLSPTFVITVNGNSLNPCGHMLLNIGGYGRIYTHIADVRGYPYFMNQKGYERYQLENNKIELSRVRVNIPNPQKAKLKLNQLKYQRWTWMVLPNNCVHYVEEILQAGGCDFNLKSNCPKIGR
ncbi:MAG: hypothetical protein PVJ84_03330 [Desulfobacteraceae bacterium]